MTKNTIFGTEGDDTLFGTAGDDVIQGLGGHDVLRGGAGNDVVRGGPDGDIRVSGGQGDDEVHGSLGDDLVKGGKGNDVVFMGAGNDTIDGGRGDDLLVGRAPDGENNSGDGNDTWLFKAGRKEGWGDDTVDGVNFGDQAIIKLADKTVYTVASVEDALALADLLNNDGRDDTGATLDGDGSAVFEFGAENGSITLLNADDFLA